MAISEIEKLERRYAQNPEGLVFASLAEAYRKSGDPARAVDILQAGLRLHPDHIPASIVLGRCQIDLGNEAAAEGAFGHVLTLDSENVIALKAVADLTERGGRFAEAAERLRQLLDVDRSNDEAREQLARVEAALAAMPAPEPEPEPADASVAEAAAAEAALDEPVGATASDESALLQETALPMVPVEPVPTETVPAAEWVEPAPTETVPTAEWVKPDAAAAEEPPAEPVTEEPLVLLEQEDVVAAWTRLDLVEDVVVLESEVTELPTDFDVTPIGEASAELELRSGGGSEFQLPSATEEFTGGALQASGSAASEFQLPDASSEFTGESLLGADAASEFQAPDAAESLLAEVSERRDEPPAEPLVETFAESAISFVEVPPTPVPEPAAFAQEEPTALAMDEEPVGEWVTWSDAALAEDAEPFPAGEPEVAEEPVAAAPAEVPAPSAAVEAIVAEQAGALAEVAVTPVPAPAAEAPAEEAEPELVVTESMAELFVRQGHAADALRVYRELAGRRPGDARIAARIAELEEQEAAARAPLAPYSARVTGGTSVRELMQTVLASRPEGVRPAPRAPTPMPAPLHAPQEAAPTRPASDHLSLSDVFGEEGPPLPPAFRSSRPPADAGVSFDEFFGGERDAEAPGEAARGVGAPRPGDDDLDQFHAWLQNLKK